MANNDGVENFVNSMVENSKKKNEKPKPQTRANVDHKDVENLLDNIRQKIQQQK